MVRKVNVRQVASLRKDSQGVELVALSRFECVGGRKDKEANEGQSAFLEGFGSWVGDQESQAEAQGREENFAEHPLLPDICFHFSVHFL